jgi:molybdopterin synthase catalytic subunit
VTAVVLRAELTEQTIELAEHEGLVAHQAAGAVVGFAGVVRDHDSGHTVTRLEYSAHPTAQQTLADVAAEIAADCTGVRLPVWKHQFFADGSDEWVGSA